MAKEREIVLQLMEMAGISPKLGDTVFESLLSDLKRCAVRPFRDALEAFSKGAHFHQEAFPDRPFKEEYCPGCVSGKLLKELPDPDYDELRQRIENLEKYRDADWRKFLALQRDEQIKKLGEDLVSMQSQLRAWKSAGEAAESLLKARKTGDLSGWEWDLLRRRLEKAREVEAEKR